MRKKHFGRLLSAVLSAAMVFTSVIPSYAVEDAKALVGAQEESEDDANAVGAETVVETKETKVTEKTEETPGVEDDEDSILVGEADPVTVYFDLNYSGASVTKIENVPANTSVLDVEGMPDTERDGYSFDGWFNDKDEDGPIDKVTEEDIVENNHTYYASWIRKSYTVSFDAKGGKLENGNEEFTVYYDWTYGEGKKLPVPELEGKSFGGWFDKSDTEFKNRITDDTTVKITAPQTLVARWLDTKAYVEFYRNEGSWSNSSSDESITAGYEIGKAYGEFPEVKAPEGMEFVGWFTKPEDGDKITEEDTATAEVTELYAVFEAIEFTVEFDANFSGRESYIEGIPNPKKYKFNEKFGAISRPYLFGYEFGGWYLFKDPVTNELSEPADADTPIKKNVTAYAKWTPIKYKVVFDANGGSGEMAEQELTYDEFGTDENPVKLSKNTFTRENYEFLGWTKNSSYNVISFSDEDRIRNNILGSEEELNAKSVKLYAVWGPKTYKVEYYFDKDSENPIETQEKISLGDIFEVPNSIHDYYEGYRFDGWFDESGKKITFGVKLTDKPASDTIKVVGHWTPIKMTVTFNANVKGVKAVKKTYKGSDKDFKDLKFDPATIFGSAIDSEKLKDFAGYESGAEAMIILPDDTDFTVNDLMSKVFYNKAAKELPASMSINLNVIWKLESAPYTLKITVKDVEDEKDYIWDSNYKFVKDDKNYTYSEKVEESETIFLTGKEVQSKAAKLTGWTVYLRSAEDIKENKEGKKLKDLKPEATIKGLAKKGEELVISPKFGAEENYKIKYTTLDGGKYVGTDKKDKLPTSYKYNTPVSLPTEGSTKMVKKGYTFVGFYEDYKCAGDLVATLGKGSNIEYGPAALYAEWKPITYKVKLEGLDNATAAEGNTYDGEPIEAKYDENVDLSNYIFTKNGSTFKNWAILSEDGKKVVKTFKANQKFKNLADSSAVITLTAQWTENKNALSVDLNGGSLKKGESNPKFYYTKEALSLKIPEKAGYVFTGYEMTKGGEGVNLSEEKDEVNTDKVVSSSIAQGSYGDVALKATWKAIKYKLVFKDAAGEVINSVTGYENLTFTSKVNLNDAARQIDKDQEKSIAGFNTTKELAAKKAAFNLTSTYEVSKLAANRDDNDGEIYLFTTPGKNKVYHITYNFETYPGAVTKKAVYTFAESNKDTALPVAVLAGYAFRKWTSEDGVLTENGLKIKAGTKKDITVAPVFESNTYKVVLDPNGKNVKSGDAAVKKAVVFDSAISYADGTHEDKDIDNLPIWTREGYTFAGFGLKKNTKPEDGITSLAGLTTKKSITLYAVWVSNSGNITFEPDKVVVLNNEESNLNVSDIVLEQAVLKGVWYEYGKSFTLPKLTVKGYEFKGWKLDKEAMENYTVDPSLEYDRTKTYVTKVKADNKAPAVSVYPVFTENEYTLKLNLNGGQAFDLKTGKTVKGTVTVGKYKYTDYVIKDVFSYADICKKASYFVGLGLTSKAAIERLPKTELTDKNNATVTLYAVFEKVVLNNNVSVKEAIYDPENKGVYIVTNWQHSSSEMYEYQVCADASFKTCVYSVYGYRDCVVSVPYGNQFYVRVRNVYSDSASKTYITGKWSKVVRAIRGEMPMN